MSRFVRSPLLQAGHGPYRRKHGDPQVEVGSDDGHQRLPDVDPYLS